MIFSPIKSNITFILKPSKLSYSIGSLALQQKYYVGDVFQGLILKHLHYIYALLL